MSLRRPVALIQARMGSTRLPGKVLAPLAGKPLIAHVVERVRSVEALAEVVVATSDLPGDEPLRAYCGVSGIPVATGSEQDVLDRFHRVAVEHEADPVVRITGDCPFVDPELLLRLLELYASGSFDHVAVATGAGALSLEGGRFPVGLDAECISFAALEEAWREAIAPHDREHVTPFIWRQPERFRVGRLLSDADLYDVRLTVDTEEDLKLARALYNALYREHEPFSYREVLDYLKTYPELRELNRGVAPGDRYREAWRG